MMQINSIKKQWLKNYKSAPEQLKKMSEIKGLISAFNANIDAVIKLSGKDIEKLIGEFNLNQAELLSDGETIINSKTDAIRGLINCFTKGIAEEWLIENKEIFYWLQENLGYDKLQMGGQGGIVANVMAVCGVNNVYVHCASLNKEQASLFLDLPNLISVDEKGVIEKANKIVRSNDIPLIHWIIEFDKGDKITVDGKEFTCPKSNRFIATYDPLNFKLHIDETFANQISNENINYEYIILSGYQMLQEELSDKSNGTDRIEASKKIISNWVNSNVNHILHLEMASTQDTTIRKNLLDNLTTEVDSLGFNERELIDLLEVINEPKLALECEQKTNSVNLFKGMLKIFEYTNCPRIQLHMFGLYVTLQQKNYKISAQQNLKGMQLAAVIAATKAGTGSIDKNEILLWAKDLEVSDVGLNELQELSNFLGNTNYKNTLMQNGLFSNNEFDLIAVPTILIDKPITLVGMGDTISSISLVAAR
jgi:ADP-dependent phosphofructokinase/glucokinase